MPGGVDDDTCLISSGALDSLALFNLVLWIEEKTGRVIDPTSVALPGEWDSVRLIMRYLELSTSAGPPKKVDRARKPKSHRVPGAHIVKYTKEYKTEVAEFQTRLWSPDANLNLRYLEWKYEQNPYSTEPKIYLALDHGEIVGMRGFYPSRWASGSPMHMENVLVADDLALREDHRNEGLYTRIMGEALDDLAGCGVEYLFNLSGGELTVLGSLAMAWRSAGCLNPVGRLSAGRALRLALRRRLAGLPYLWRHADSTLLDSSSDRNPFEQLDRLGAFKTASGVAINVENRPRSFDMAALVRSQADDGRLRHARDDAFFRWRFQNPLHEYRFLYAGDDKLDGYLVVKRLTAFPRSSPRVSIVDLEAKDEQTGSALLHAVIHMGRLAELVIWSATLGPRFCAELRRLAFKPVDLQLAHHGLPCIMVRSIDDARPEGDWRINGVRLLDLDNWDMRMIYSMAG